MLHIPILKPQNPQAQALQVSLASLITLEFVPVAVTINLNDQLQLRAIEIDDVFVDGPLSQKLIAEHFVVFQLVPQQHFSQGTVLPEFSRTFFQFLVVVKHDLYFALTS